MKNKIVFLDANTLGNLDLPSEFSRLGTYSEYNITKTNQRIERIGENNIVITNKVTIDRDVMDACPELELICIAATGMNNVDLDYAKSKHIRVMNVAGYSTESVAQSTFSMLFYLLHHSAYFDRYVKSGEYARSSVFTHHGREYWELRGKNYGIIGLGTIGQRVAEIAAAFGANVIYYSTSGRNDNRHYPRKSLNELLQACDVISIHCPLNDKTRNLIDEEQLEMMKPEACLLNLGRGGIVNETALAKALNNESIACAGLDVLESEPINADNPLLKCKHPERLFITPHTAWASVESRKLLVQKIVENIDNYLNEKK